VLWEKTVTYPAQGSPTESDTVTASLRSSPGRQSPQPKPICIGCFARPLYFSLSCPIEGYQSLDAGLLTVQGPDSGPVQATNVAAQQADLGWSADGAPIAISGLKIYRATLPGGSIHPGSYTVSAAGGGDLGAFQSSVQIGSGIQVTTAL